MSVNLDGDQNFVHVVLSGDLTKDTLGDAREEASRMLIENDTTKLLIDVSRGEKKISIFEDFEFTEEHRLHFPNGTRIAMVASLEQRRSLRHVEAFSQSDAVYMQLFVDEDEAIDWLVNRSA